jgi:hypothetical protein
VEIEQGLIPWCFQYGFWSNDKLPSSFGMVYQLAIQTQVAPHAIGRHAGMYRQDSQQIAHSDGCQEFVRSLNDPMFLGNAFHEGTVAWNVPSLLVKRDNLSKIFASIFVD